MTTLMVSHEITDLAAWRAAYDAGAAIRDRHGAVSARVLRDENFVLGLIEFPDESSARAFLADPDLARPVPGVPGAPSVRLLHETDRTG